MNGLLSDRERFLALAGLLFALGLLITVTAGTRRNGANAPSERVQREGDVRGEKKDGKDEWKHDGAEKYLFVWAGDQSRSSPDFLAVVNFDERSPDYGMVVNTLPLPGPGASGNEPHHVGLSRDGRTLACGGLLSVLRGQDEIFFFDVSDPAAPRFIS